MASVEWTPKARKCLKDIARYIARQDYRPATADKLVDDIEAKCAQYAAQPELGSRHDALPGGFRLFVHKRYVVIFERLDSGIRVHLVVDGARDWPLLFGDE